MSSRVRRGSAPLTASSSPAASPPAEQEAARHRGTATPPDAFVLPLRAGAPAAPGHAAPWRPPREGQWTLDAHGVRSDPVNLYAHGTLDQLKALLVDTGWLEARPNTPENNRRYIAAVPASAALNAADRVAGLLDRDVDNDQVWTVASMPVSPQTLDGRPLVSAFERNNNPLGGRDHLRIFDTGQRDVDGNSVWAIAASRDTAIKFDVHRPEQGFLNHAVEANTDLERDYLHGSIRDSVLVAQTRRVAVDFGREPAPASGALPRDGAVYDILLK